ncbi:geranylgeranyl reductase family protein [Thermocrinis sp.]
MRKIKCEVLIVGGGPAGSTAAYRLAKGGAKVLVVDFKRVIGSPVQCAEFVPIQLYHRFSEFFDEKVVAQKVDKMIHFTPWGEIVSMDSPGFVLNRELFDYKIHLLAVENGASYMLRTKFVDFYDNKIAVLENIESREKILVEFDLLIGADGPRSKVAKLSGDYTKHFLTTAQITVSLKHPTDDLVIFFRDYIPAGYGWIFPKGTFANVGVGIDPCFGINVMEVLRMFVKELVKNGFIEDRALRRTGGWIPAEGLLEVVRGRVVLIGDAGGFCHPITGGGIANAVLSGSMCAEAILNNKLEDFAESAEDTFGETLRRASLKRKIYMREWDNLEERIRKTWVAFKEYWEG